MKTTTLKLSHLIVLLLLVVSAVACNDRVPTNRPLITGATTGNDDDDTDEEIVKRPDGAVFIKSVCGCNNGTNILVPEATCNTFCAGKSTSGRDRLYLTFDVSADISLDPNLVNTNGWCTKSVNDDDANPVCDLMLKYQVDSDVVNTLSQQITGLNGSTGNAFFFDFDSATLPQDTTFLLTLRSTSTAGEFKSDSTQIRKIKPGVGPIDPGPIGIQPVSQYACVNRIQQPTGSTTNSQPALIAANQLHFYFIEQFRPDPLPDGFSTGFCHNVVTYGNTDAPQYPRLFEEANALALWRTDDPKMLDLKNPTTVPGTTDWTTNIDAEDIIVQKLKEMGATSGTSRFFGKFSISSGPTVNTAGNASNANTPLGFYMRLFVDRNTSNNFAVCPKAADYAGSQVLFRAIGEVVQVDTEGIYLARRQQLTYTYRDDNNVLQTRCVDDDYLIVREADLRKHWFYFQNGTARRPGTGVSGELAIKNNTMNFYYPFREPANPSDPPVQQVDQKLYTIILPSMAGPTSYCAALNGTSTTGGVPQTPDSTAIADSIPPHDKRFGCIPVSNTN